jgi:hypothetical protein
MLIEVLLWKIWKPVKTCPISSAGPKSASFSSKQQASLDFVLAHYVSVGVEELDQEKLTPLLRLKYHNSISDAR